MSRSIFALDSPVKMPIAAQRGCSGVTKKGRPVSLETGPPQWQPCVLRGRLHLFLLAPPLRHHSETGQAKRKQAVEAGFRNDLYKERLPGTCAVAVASRA